MSKENVYGDKAIRSCNSKLTSYRQLNTLYFLTLADMKATGPIAYNEYKIGDLSKLYHTIINFRFERKTASKCRQIKTDTLLELCHFHNISHAATIVSDMNWERYYEIFSDEELFLHLKMEDETRPERLTFFNEKTDKIRKTTILSKKANLSLQDIMGVLLENKITIYDYRSYSFSEKTVVHSFRTDRHSDTVFENEKWSKITDRLDRTASDKPKSFYSKDAFSTDEAGCVFNPSSKVNVKHSSTDKTVLIELVSQGSPRILYKIINRLLLNKFKIIFFRKTNESQGCLYTFQISDTHDKLDSVKTRKELSKRLLREVINDDE